MTQNEEIKRLEKALKIATATEEEVKNLDFGNVFWIEGWFFLATH